MFCLALVLNIILDFLRKTGINNTYIVIEVVFIGCSAFSVFYVLYYFYSWRKIYLSAIKKGSWPIKTNQSP